MLLKLGDQLVDLGHLMGAGDQVARLSGENACSPHNVRSVIPQHTANRFLRLREPRVGCNRDDARDGVFQEAFPCVVTVGSIQGNRSVD